MSVDFEGAARRLARAIQGKRENVTVNSVDLQMVLLHREQLLMANRMLMVRKVK